MMLPVETELTSLPLADVVIHARNYGPEAFTELFGDNPVFVIRPKSGRDDQALFNTPPSGTQLPDTQRFTDEQMNETQSDEFFLGWAGFVASSPVLPMVKSERNPFTGVITVGRALHNDIRLTSPRVSRLHAFVRLTPNAWTVQDANSSNGVFVNAVRLEPNVEHRLRAGDELRFADITGTFLDRVGLLALCQIIRL